MAVIANNESIIPFFGERLSFVKGLDPLGLQNTSDSTFTILLPGLNNVTGRIRYYSFYSWLLDAYSKVSGSTNPMDQRQFIRRAEYIVALVSHYTEKDRSSIPGSNYAGLEVNVKQLTRHNLQEGTFKQDGSTRDTYWNYPLGAFGQYYLGSLRDIGIVIERENHAGLYVRTNKRGDEYVSGEELANAFADNIDISKQKLFLSSIESGSITKNQLQQLLPDFNLTSIPRDSSESELLKKLLLQKDFPLRIEEIPRTMRRQTIKSILRYLSTHENEEFYERIFVYNCYDVKGWNEAKPDECLTGWYYYQFNEFWQYACTSILNGTLSYLEKHAGPNWMPLTSLINDVTEKVVAVFTKQKLIKPGNESVDDLLGNISGKETEYSFFDSTAASQLTSKVANAFLLIFSIYLNNYQQLPGLKVYSENNDVAKDGEGVSYFLTRFVNRANQATSKFIYEFIFNNIIYRHQYVAFRKTGGGSLSTQKFIIEDQHIRYIGNFEAGYTSPRIGRLISFLEDLGILSPDNDLTRPGQEMLKDLSSKND